MHDIKVQYMNQLQEDDIFIGVSFVKHIDTIDIFTKEKTHIINLNLVSTLTITVNRGDT